MHEETLEMIREYGAAMDFVGRCVGSRSTRLAAAERRKAERLYQDIAARLADQPTH